MCSKGVLKQPLINGSFSAGKTIGKKAFVITFLLSVLLIYQVYIFIYVYVALKGGMYDTVHI